MGFKDKLKKAAGKFAGNKIEEITGSKALEKASKKIINSASSKKGSKKGDDKED